MAHTNMVSCHWCGNPQAEGHAWIDDLRYCHDDDVDVTCFMRAQWSMGVTNPWLDFDRDG